MRDGPPRLWAAMVCCALVASVCWFAIAHDSHGWRGPATIDDVEAAAQELGLFYARVRGGLSGDVLLVSNTPVRAEQARSPRFGDLDHPFWTGRVLVMGPHETSIPVESPRPTAQWGEIDFYGDPGLIRQLLHQ